MNRRANTLMVQGTGSSVGKSTLVAALCRIFMQDGVRVAPFKAQNMSNNAFVTPDGLELGRAQAVQAAAAGIESSSDMNPILLKPEGDGQSQVVLNGRSQGSFKARSYYQGRDTLWTHVTAALDRLRDEHELVVIEGAGSPAEVNLRDRDIANMEVALYAGSPVLLAGDIDRGGVFASLLGTLELLRPDERALVSGLIINKFRGDRSLLEPLPAMIADRTGVEVVGVVPMVPDLQVQEEDGMSIERQSAAGAGGPLFAAVIRLPRISNFDDFDPLIRAGVRVRYVTSPSELREAHIVIIPGTKNTIADLRWMKSRGLDSAVVEAEKRGAAVVGLCGGFQILGRRLEDRSGIDSGVPGVEQGLGLLPVDTTFDGEKVTRRVEFRALNSAPGWEVGAGGGGYEIHAGRSVRSGGPTTAGLIELHTIAGDVYEDGAVCENGRLFGCYVHGLFDSPEILVPFLTATATRNGLDAPAVKPFSMDKEFDRLADAVRNSVNMDAIRRMAGLAR
jgi:adenosylcobyric acid synthase